MCTSKGSVSIVSPASFLYFDSGNGSFSALLSVVYPSQRRTLSLAFLSLQYNAVYVNFRRKVLIQWPFLGELAAVKARHANTESSGPVALGTGSKGGRGCAGANG